MRFICVLFAAMAVSATSLPQEGLNGAPWLATPIFARITKIDIERGKVFYAWCALEPIPVEVFEGKKKPVQEIRLGDLPRTGIFDLSKGLVLNSSGRTLKSPDALTSLEVGATVIVVFRHTIPEAAPDFPTAYLEAIHPKTKILLHQSPDQKTIKDFYGERVIEALIGGNL